MIGRDGEDEGASIEVVDFVVGGRIRRGADTEMDLDR